MPVHGTWSAQRPRGRQKGAAVGTSSFEHCSSGHRCTVKKSPASGETTVRVHDGQMLPRPRPTTSSPRREGIRRRTSQHVRFGAVVRAPPSRRAKRPGGPRAQTKSMYRLRMPALRMESRLLSLCVRGLLAGRSSGLQGFQSCCGGVRQVEWPPLGLASRLPGTLEPGDLTGATEDCGLRVALALG